MSDYYVKTVKMSKWAIYRNYELVGDWFYDTKEKAEKEAKKIVKNLGEECFIVQITDRLRGYRKKDKGGAK